MRTVDEKYKYNQAQNTRFAVGYCTAVILYRSSKTKQERQTHNEIIDGMKRQAVMGDEHAKGYLCAIRDCANERKQKSNLGGKK